MTMSACACRLLARCMSLRQSFPSKSRKVCTLTSSSSGADADRVVSVAEGMFVPSDGTPGSGGSGDGKGDSKYHLSIGLGSGHSSRGHSPFPTSPAAAAHAAALAAVSGALSPLVVPRVR